ncbi:MAG: transporter, partial [Peptostreptococcaceae bacterium]
LSIGFLVSMIGAMYLVLVATKTNSLVSVCISLIFMGLGMGFTMGAPLNYMMLENTKPEEANSALATLSLVRSIGTSISPAIMIGFIAHAGLSVQDNVMNILPEVKSPKITQVEELQSMVNDLKSDPEMAKQLKDVKIPDLNTQTNMKINSSSGDLPKELLDKVKDSDVTNITDITKEISVYMFDKNTPSVINKIESNVQQGIDGTQKGIDGITTGENKLKKGIDGIQTGINNMKKASSEIKKASEGIKSGINGIDQGIAGMQAGITKQDNTIAEMKTAYDRIPPQDTADREKLKAQLDALTASRNELNTKLQSSKAEKKQMESKLVSVVSQQNKLSSELNQSKYQKQEMSNALVNMGSQKDSLVVVLNKTKEVQEAVPKAFEKSKTDYLNTIESMSDKIEKVFQDTLNVGFRQMYICVFVINTIAFTILLFYKK